MLKSCRPIILTGLSGFLFLLLFIMRLDYSIYLFRTYGLLYSQVLGFCVTAALVLVYRKSFLGKRFSPLFVAMTVFIGYPLFGAFALLAGILMTILALREGKRGFEDLAVALLAGAAAPWLCGELSGIFPGIHRKYVYLAAFPYNRIGGGAAIFASEMGDPDLMRALAKCIGERSASKMSCSPNRFRPSRFPNKKVKDNVVIMNSFNYL